MFVMVTKNTYEKAGLFYLGKDVGDEEGDSIDVPTLLKNKNFTTHAAIIGMTGSGKTGLGIGIIEEAAMDNIPSIVIDPKGDMGDLCLTDPRFRPEKFLPWVREEAEAKGEDPRKYAAKTAETWKKGIESWGQGPERVERFQKVEKTIYTPGSLSGMPVNLMSSLQVPHSSVMEDGDYFAAYLKSTVGSLLALLDIEADPLESKEYILLAQIIAHAWNKGEDIGIESLIGRIVTPPFKKIGVLPLESFYPEKERFRFATRFNAVIASPDFVNWLSGDGLDIQKLLFDENGRAKIAIFSIAHLGDEERMFFVTLLLNRYIAWMRMQSGSTRLRTLLYMDEIYGFFPPVKNPPSKEPMITLLKQARAYGVGIVLSTQNPVDLDYKGLSNIGTWFIGRLQTRQDIERVVDGLGNRDGEGLSREEIMKLLANLPKRTFFLKSSHLDSTRLFGTRWVMSYLKGPLKKAEISALMERKKKRTMKTDLHHGKKGFSESLGSLPVLPGSIPQYFEVDPTQKKHYMPWLAAETSVEFHDQRRGIDQDRIIHFWLPLDPGMQEANWEDAENDEQLFGRWPKIAPTGADFAALPSFISHDSSLKNSSRLLRNMIYRNERLILYRCRRLKLESDTGEEESDFLVRIRDRIADLKEEAIEKLKERYASKENRLHEQLKRARERVEKEKADQTGSLISMGVSILGALFGGKGISAGKIGTAVNRGGKVLRERGDLSRAEERVREIIDKLETVGNEMEEKIDAIDGKYVLDNYPVETFSVRPRKADIKINSIALVWRPEL